ncbi:hypothetical protein CN987_01965 [Bacillus thuringiensis]|nr:hypothetical protein CN987_01965 [Bacillus thuringiensis]
MDLIASLFFIIFIYFYIFFEFYVIIPINILTYIFFKCIFIYMIYKKEVRIMWRDIGRAIGGWFR